MQTLAKNYDYIFHTFLPISYDINTKPSFQNLTQNIQLYIHIM